MMASTIAAVVSTVLLGVNISSAGCDQHNLEVDGETGMWSGWHIDGFAVAPFTPDGTDFGAGTPGGAWPETSQWQVLSNEVECDANGGTQTIVRATEEWQVTQTIRLTASPPWRLSRQITLLRKAGGRVKVEGTSFRSPWLTLGDAPDTVWSIPGNWPPFDGSARDAAPGQEWSEQGWPASDAGVACVYSEEKQAGVVASFAFDRDEARVYVVGGKQRVALEHRFYTLKYLEDGQSLDLGTQWLELVRGDRQALRTAATKLAARVHPGPPVDRPRWLDGAVIAEVHPWGRLEMWPQMNRGNRGDRGNRVAHLTTQLPHLKNIGVTAVWLLPVSNKPPWVYFLPEFRYIDPLVATPEGLAQFADAAHDLGMTALLDIVTYGLSPDSPEAPRQPDEVWALDERGERRVVWGGAVLAADCSVPAWQETSVARATYWVRDFGFDGFRLDVGGRGQTPNWGPNQGRRANEAMMYGGVRQNRAMRDAIRAINDRAILMPEAGSPCLWPSADLLFDYPLYLACRQMTETPDIGRWVAQLGRWLNDQEQTHSPRQQQGLVRFLENHDTISQQEYFGNGPGQACTALCAFLPGVFLLHQEEEIGFERELAEWLALRRELPDFQVGRVDWHAVTASDPSVLAFARATDEGASIVAINFGPWDTETRLDLIPAWRDTYPAVQDAFSGAPISLDNPLPIPSYRPRVVTLRTEARTVAPASGPTVHAEESSLVLDRSEEVLEADIIRYVVQPQPAAQWFVTSVDGLATGAFVDRNKQIFPDESHVDITPTLARCWRPLTHRQWDSLDEPAFGVMAEDGRMLEVSVHDRARLVDARIEDPSAQGETVRLVIEQEAGAPVFTVHEHADGMERLAALRARPESEGPLTVEPQWVRWDNGRYRVALARRHGGVIRQVARNGWDGPLGPGAQIYSDSGLFGERKAGTHYTHTPVLNVDREAAAVSFAGQLHFDSWNGVQAAAVATPDVRYRTAYRFGADAVRVRVSAKTVADRPDLRAFLAWRVPVQGVRSWRVEGTDLTGHPGQVSGERVYQTKTAQSQEPAAFYLDTQFGELVLSDFDGGQNFFLADDGEGQMVFFAALLDGEPQDWRTESDLQLSFTLALR